MLHLRTIQDIDSSKILCSKEINHGDFPFRFMIKIEYTEDWGESAVSELGKYCVTLAVVSPDQAKQTDAYTSALSSYGWTVDDIAKYGPYAEYEMLLDYGTYAHLWQNSGNNLGLLLKACRAMLAQSDMLFGFAMDRTENAIGTTGWDMVRGDVLAPLRRYSDSDAPNVQLMRKLQGGV